ncbi:MAG: transposase [Ruminiclostridium sp.]|nr:transposase [Ruminiclostridium sp.]
MYDKIKKGECQKMGTGRQYDEEFKKQAIKLGKEVGIKAAAEELGIPKGTLGTWLKKAREGEIDTGSGTRTPEESLNLAEQLHAANKRIKELEKSNRELKELNEFLEEASAFFAASRRKSGKKND